MAYYCVMVSLLMATQLSTSQSILRNAGEKNRKLPLIHLRIISLSLLSADACREHRDHALYPHPDRCDLFLECVDGEAYSKQCAVGLHFNVRRRTCDFPHVAQCTIPLRISSSASCF